MILPLQCHSVAVRWTASLTMTRMYGNLSLAKSVSATAERLCATRWSARIHQTVPIQKFPTENAAPFAPMRVHLLALLHSYAFNAHLAPTVALSPSSVQTACCRKYLSLAYCHSHVGDQWSDLKIHFWIHYWNILGLRDYGCFCFFLLPFGHLYYLTLLRAFYSELLQIHKKYIMHYNCIIDK